MSNKEKEFEVLDALQDMFYSMAERMSADHVWSAKELEDMGDILFSGERNRLSDYIDRLVKLTEIPAGFAIVPVEPTNEMQNSARDWSVATLGHAVGGSGSRGCYQAMIGAAPKPADK